MVLLHEIFAKDIDLGHFEKKVLVNIHLAGEDGLNITTLYPLEPNKQNLKRAKDELLDFGFIEETDQRDFYTVTDTGTEALSRASLIDDNGELNDVQASKFLYEPEGEDTDTEMGMGGDSIGDVGGIDDVGSTDSLF